MSGQWLDGRAYRDGLTLTIRQFGLFDQPLVATLDAQRAPLGGNLSIAISRPFLSDLEHIAWYAGGMHDNSYRAFVRDGWARRCRCRSRGTSGRPAPWPATPGEAAAR